MNGILGGICRKTNLNCLYIRVILLERNSFSSYWPTDRQQPIQMTPPPHPQGYVYPWSVNLFVSQCFVLIESGTNESPLISQAVQPGNAPESIEEEIKNERDTGRHC